MGKKKLLKKLRQAAAKLPPAHRIVKVRVSGEEILKNNPNATTKDGKPIDAKAFYNMDAPQRVNHYRAMKTEMKNGGIKNAAGYFQAVIEVAKQREAKNKKAA